jgi:hypothetical protein
VTQHGKPEQGRAKLPELEMLEIATGHFRSQAVWSPPPWALRTC